MIDRRTMLAGLAVTVPASMAGAAPPEPGAQLETFLRLKADLSGRPAAIAYRSDIFLLTPSGTLPLIARAEGLSWNRIVRRGDAYELIQVDAGHYLAADADTPLAELALPGMAKPLAVRPYRTTSRYTARADSLSVPSLAKQPNVSLDVARRGPFEAGDQIFAHEDLQVEMGTPPRRVAQLTTYTGPAAALADRRVTSVPATSFSAMVTDTRPLLRDLVPTRPAFWRLVGRKLMPGEPIPASLRAWIAAAHPDLLTEPRLD